MNWRHLAIALLGSFTVLLVPSLAQACGGTFCDNTAIPMPVDQRGEDILFVQDGPDIEVHVRIEYTGEAERFAWLVPLQALPDISVGSELLFRTLADETAPEWRTNLEYECFDEHPSGGSTMGFVPASDFGAAAEPDIVLEQTVGAFDVVVLQGGTAAEVVEFLAVNGYAQDPQATPILQEYLDDGFLFAAVKLTAGAQTDEIHPLVFRMPGDEPCVPLRLTSIAAEEDMGVRAYFLGQQRWGPLNYKHVVLNTLAFPWNDADNITNSRKLHLQQLSAAVDVAGGRAFVTDYAGTSQDIPTWNLLDNTWDETAFIGVDPITAINLIALQGLNRHPLIQSLLLQFIPPPDGVDAQDFWNNIELYADLIDLAAWDSVAFADALSERIIEPGVHALDLLETWPYLTRLHTTISPHEMTVDPIFMPIPELGGVDNEIDVRGVDLCGEVGSVFTVPWPGDTFWSFETKEVCTAEFAVAWPQLLSSHPVLRIEQLSPLGPPQVEEDFSQVILADWMAHQAQQSCAEPGGDSGDGDSGDGDSGDGDSGGGGQSESDDAGVSDGADQASCACSTDARREFGAPFGLALGLFGVAFLRLASGRPSRSRR